MNIKQQIEIANNRDVGQFHVFCDMQNYHNGVWIGECNYHSSWPNLSSAIHVASKQDNGKVFNSFGKEVSK